ncbi:MAG: magnesium transporter [Patescibacteria group bacterium]|nr:magnesium transporter [Patescibacteria group bacterium]
MQHSSIKAFLRDFSYNSSKRLILFRQLTLDEQVKVIKSLSRYIKQDVLNKLEVDEVKAIIEMFDPVESTDLLQLLPKKKREKIIEVLNETIKKDVALLLSFDPDTAAGLMNLNYVQVDENHSMEEVAEKVKIHEERTGKLPLILVQKEEQVTGFLPVHKLVFAKRSEKASNYIKKIATIKQSATQTEVMRFFKNNPHRKAIVLGEKDNVLGVIYSDDILRLLQEQAGSSLYDFAGLRDEETIYDTIKRKVKYRYKWLILNLGTAFLAAFTVGLFEDTIAAQVLLAVYMPIVAGMGGNAGTQTLAIMVRGLSSQEIGKKEVLHVLKNEVGAGFINGLINGLIVFGIVVIFNQNILVATVLAVAMIVNLLIAATFGTLVPVLMQRLGKDPAASATIFITTATDIFGFMAFLGLATLLLL